MLDNKKIKSRKNLEKTKNLLKNEKKLILQSVKFFK